MHSMRNIDKTSVNNENRNLRVLSSTSSISENGCGYSDHINHRQVDRVLC